jgi:hypothetical protein
VIAQSYGRYEPHSIVQNTKDALSTAGYAESRRKRGPERFEKYVPLVLGDDFLCLVVRRKAIVVHVCFFDKIGAVCVIFGFVTASIIAFLE